MATQSAKVEEVLARFGELAKAKATEVSGVPNLRVKIDGGVLYFPCPLADSTHGWTGNDPQARLTIKDGQLACFCRICTPKPPYDVTDDEDYKLVLERYTEAVKTSIGWDDKDNPLRASVGRELIRGHDYTTVDGVYVLRHQKYRERTRNSQPTWGFLLNTAEHAQQSSIFYPFRWIAPAAFLAERYAFKHYYNAVNVYQHELFYQDGKLKGFGQVVVCEGEKDADTFNRLMAAGRHGLTATALPDQKPAMLAPHQKVIFQGRDVVLIGDNDDAGRQSQEKWCAVLWGIAATIKALDTKLFGTKPSTKKSKQGEEVGCDLTEWVEALEASGHTEIAIAQTLVNAIGATHALTESLLKPKGWLETAQRTAKGVLYADSPHNAFLAWTKHTDMAGRVRFNTCTGEIEVTDPPWGGEIYTGAHDLAFRYSGWLEQAENIRLRPRELEDALKLRDVAQPYNPFAWMLEDTWDKERRVDELWTRYIPLDVEPDAAILLARVTMVDLVRKLRGDFVAQRALMGIETDEVLDVAAALAGEYGKIHNARVTRSEVETLTRHTSAVVQVPMSTIANRQNASLSLPHMFAPSVWITTQKRKVIVPLFLALGSEPGDPRTDAKVDERCYQYQLTDRAQLEELGDAMPMLLAETVARLAEFAEAKPPSKGKTKTLDEKNQIKKLDEMTHCLWLYVMREVEGVDIKNPQALKEAPERTEPMRYVVRTTFLDTMRARLGYFREAGDAEHAFNTMCRIFKWASPQKKGSRRLGVPKVGITQGIARVNGIDIGGKDQASLNGVFMSDKRIEELRSHCFPDELVDIAVEAGPAPSPKGEGAPLSRGPSAFTRLPTSTPEAAESLEAAENKGTQASFTTLSGSHSSGKRNSQKVVGNGFPEANRIDSLHARTHNTIVEEGKWEKAAGWLVGDEAVEKINSILGTPGWCAIDFETYPPSPKWMGAEAAEASIGNKAEDRKQAILAAKQNGRAGHRTACTIQVCHEDGSEAAAQLTDPADQLPRMFNLVLADLVAHNAQFEAEVLVKHGVEIDIDCTLLAAKALYLVALPDDAPQRSFSLAALVKDDLPLGRIRDKTLRDRDWRQDASLDAEALAYGLDDVRDCLALWLLYRGKLEQEGLLAGYQLIARSVLATAAMNVRGGLVLDGAAHAALMERMATDAADLLAQLRQIAPGIANHASTQQVSVWILEQVLQVPIKPPTPPAVTSLCHFLRLQGGLRHHADLKGLLPRGTRLVKPGGLSLTDAEAMARAAGYPVQGRLVERLEADARGDHVLTLDDALLWGEHEQELAEFKRLRKDDEYRYTNFITRLTGKVRELEEAQGKLETSEVRWRRTETGHLALSKGAKLRKAAQLAEIYPDISRYLLTHGRWTKATKLINAFGATLQRWQENGDAYGRSRCRGQFKTWAAWTGRQSCADPNLQQMPREPEFRALWIAPPGRKLVIADYSQIELRLLAIESGDEVLRQIYRDGRDIHREIGSVAFALPIEEVDKPTRNRAKPISFGIAYGSGAIGLAEHGGFSLNEAAVLLERVLTAYPGLRTFRDQAPATAARDKHITIRPGRRVRYTDKSSPTQAINGPIQGGAASVQMLALRMVHDALARRPKLGAFIAASVHDELLIEVGEEHAEAAAALLVDCMTRALVEIYPQAEEMGLARLTEAAVVSSWAEKP